VTPEAQRELAVIVKENGGGTFAVSVFLREDGFFSQFNLMFLARLRAAGRLQRFCELLNEAFQEDLENAEKEIWASNHGGGGGFYAHKLPGVSKQD
jgi:hypothetical protein